MKAGFVAAIWARLSRVLPAGGFRRNVAVLSGGTALSQGLLVLASPALTRLYAPDDMGVWTVYGSVLSVLTVMASLRYELAIPLPEDDRGAANLLAVALASLCATSLLVSAGAWLLGERVVFLLGAPSLRPYLWFLPLGMVALGVFQAFNYWALRRRAFFSVARAKLSQNLGVILTQLSLGLLRAGPLGLLVADVMGRTAGAGALVALVCRHDRGSLRQVNLREIRVAAARYRRFPLLSSGASLLNALGAQVPLLLTASLYGTTVMGWFSLAQKVMVVPLSLVAASAAQVFFGEAAKAVRSKPEHLPQLFNKMLWGMLAVALPYVAALALSARAWFPVVFGQAWSESAVYVQILAAMVVLDSMASPISGTLDVLERQDLNLANEIARFCLMVGAVVIARSLQLAPRMGIALYSVAGVLSYLSLLLTCAYAIRASAKLVRPTSRTIDRT